MKQRTTTNLNYRAPKYQAGGFLKDLLGMAGTGTAGDPSSFGGFGQAGQQYQDLLKGSSFAEQTLPEWGDAAAQQFRNKIIGQKKLKKSGNNWVSPEGVTITDRELTDAAGQLYDKTKESQKTFNEALPLTNQLGSLFSLNQMEQQELQNKKSTLQDYPTVRSSFAPAGFSEDGGKIEAYNNLMGLFANGGGTQQGGRVSAAQQMMGYKDNSPYRNMPYQNIYSDTITMDGVSTPLMAIPNTGNPVMMAPNSGQYYFPGASQVTEVPMYANGGMRMQGVPQAKIGDFFKGIGRTVSDYGRGMADAFGNMTGLYDISNQGYKTKFGQKFAGTADKWMRGVGSIGRTAANIFLPGSGTALSAVGKTLNPQGLGSGEAKRQAETQAFLSGSTEKSNPLASLLGGAGGGNLLGSLLGGAGGGGGNMNMLSSLLGGGGGNLLSGLIPSGENGGMMEYRRLNGIFQEGGPTMQQPQPQQQQPNQEQPEGENKFMALPLEQQVEIYKGLVDFVMQNGIETLMQQYPEEYEFFEAFNEYLDDLDDAENGEEEDDDLNRPEQMANGGIPQRYKNLGFYKVGQKRQSTRPGKKWMVLAKKGDKYKVVHGGAKGMSDFTKHRNEKRKGRFWDRMGGQNSAKAKDPFSPLYWHKRFGTWVLLSLIALI